MRQHQSWSHGHPRHQIHPNDLSCHPNHHPNNVLSALFFHHDLVVIGQYLIAGWDNFNKKLWKSPNVPLDSENTTSLTSTKLSGIF